MLRCTPILFLLAGCASAPVEQAGQPGGDVALAQEPAAAPAERAAGVATPEAVAEAATEAAGDADPAEAADSKETDGIESQVTVMSDNFQYSMTLKLPNGKPDIRCSYGKRTGSHVQDKHCRTTHDAQRERDAARDFFDEARRKGSASP